MTKWSTKALTKKDAATDFSHLFKDEYAVMLLQGKNTFGDMIYSYVKVAMPDIKHLYAAMQSGANFNPSDFGTVVAAGKGEPTPEIRAEMNNTYHMLQPINPGAFPASQMPAEEKKAWDEY